MDIQRSNNNARIQPLPIDTSRKSPDDVETDGAPAEVAAVTRPTEQPLGIRQPQDTYSSTRVRTADVPGNTADAAALTSLYSQLLGRVPTDRELSRYQGVDLTRVEKSIKEGIEYRVRTFGDAVRSMYSDSLGRVPTDKEMDKFTGMMASGLSDTDTRKRIIPSLTISSGLNQINIQTSNAAVGNAPGAAKVNGDVTAMSDIDTREFNKGAVISMTKEGSKVTQYAQNGIVTVQTPQGALVYQNPKDKKMTIYTSEGWVIEATLDKFQGTDRNGNPASKGYVQLKVTDPQGNVKLDRTKPDPAAQGNSVEIDGVSMEVSTDRTAGVINELTVNVPGLKVTLGSTGASTFRLGNSKSTDEALANTTIKYSPDKLEFAMNGLGRAFYDSSATVPELPVIGKPPSIPITPTNTDPITPTLPTTPADPTPSPLDPPPATITPNPAVASTSGGAGSLIGTVGRVANSAYQSTKGAAPVASQIKELFTKGGSAAADAASSATEAASVATRAAESGVTTSGVATNAAKSGFMAGLKGLASAIGKATLISAAIEGVVSIVDNVFKVYRGEQDTGTAVKNVATDTVSGAIGGGLSALAGGAATVGLAAVGLAGLPLTLAAAGVGMLAYWFSRSFVHDKVGNLFGLDKTNTQQVAIATDGSAPALGDRLRARINE